MPTQKQNIRKDSNRAVVFAFCIGFIICFLLLKSTNFKDIGLNLLSELIGVAFTVYIIDYFIKKREDARNFAPKYLAYKKINQLLSNYIWFWRNLYRSSVPHSEPNKIEDFFSNEVIFRIWENLNLDKTPNNPAYLALMQENEREFVFTGNYWKFIPHQLTKIENEIIEITRRFGNYIEPDIYSNLNAVIEAEYFKNLKDLKFSQILYENRIKNKDLRFDNRPILKSQAMISTRPTSDDLETIIFLYNWCLENYNEYWYLKSDELITNAYSNFKYGKTSKYNGESLSDRFIQP